MKVNDYFQLPISSLKLFNTNPKPMFGIMKKRCGTNCGMDKDTYRLHYCGTCKSIGSIYDQKSRLFLNFDAVFLAELLSALSSENIQTWQDGYQSHNCFARIDEEKIPVPLQYSAAANVFLSELKTLDHIHDERKFFWKSLQFVYSKSFKKAQENLEKFGLNTSNINGFIQEQFKLEQEKNSLETYASPTAKITSLIFRQGAKLIQTDANSLERIGFEFGKLAYLLDAFEDYEKDFKSNAFNGIQQAYSLEAAALSPTIKDSVSQQIYDIQNQIIILLKQLELPKHIQASFISRLVLNVSGLLNNSIEKEEIEFETESSYSWKVSQEKAKAIVVNMKQPIKRRIQYASLSIAIFVRPETLDSIKGMDINQLGITTTLATLFSAFACFAGKKKRKIKRRLRWLQKGCFTCSLCDCCDCCDCADCLGDSICGNCWNECSDSCGEDCNNLLKKIKWIAFGILMLIIIILIIIAAV